MTVIKAAHRQGKPAQAVRPDRSLMLPAQERDLMQEYLATGNLGQAARNVGISRNRALSALRSIAWLDELRRAYESAGLSANQLGVSLRQALEANLQVRVRVGPHEESILEYPDWARRLKALDMVVQLHLQMAKSAPKEFEDDRSTDRTVIVTPTEVAGFTRAQVLELVRKKLNPTDPPATDRTETQVG